nr:DUF2804 domain-containing protein [Isoptericola halotolerans]
MDPDAVGWTREPLHDTSGIGRGRRRGRDKRWEYWGIMTPTHVVAVTTAALDYAALHQVYVLERSTGIETDDVVVAPLSGTAELPGTIGGGAVRSRTRRVEIAVDDAHRTAEPAERGGHSGYRPATRLRARTSRVELDVVIARPATHEVLGVVVPWSSRRFQYTVKDVGRPVRGSLRVDGTSHAIAGPAWAVHDHGRGRWPYSVSWQWGVGFGTVRDAAGRERRVGLQLGGSWTRQGPTTENAVFVDGRLHKIHDELEWSFDPHAYLRPWHVRGERLDLSFAPFFDRVSRTNLGVVASATDQCFGRWSGWVTTDSGERLDVGRLEGWAEDVRQRW